MDPFRIVLVYFLHIQWMLDCHLFKSYGQKKKSEKRVQVWHASSSDPWNMGVSPTRKHPPCDPKSNNQMQKEQLKVISMLVPMETKDSLRRCAIMVITKKYGLACAEQKLHISWA